MTICVTNCFHWIGFHIVNRLIENDYIVDGLAELTSEREEELSFMLGRNSSFSLYKNEDQIKDKEYTDTVLLSENKTYSIQTVKTYNFGKDIDKPNFINIQLPLLFGEWMPMDQKGVYVDNQYIPFDSARFKDEAIYIDDFMECFMQWMKVSDLPNLISLTKKKNVEVTEEGPEKQLFIRGNRPIDKQISNLIKHYEKIKKYKM
ncbi:hypothetical protein [Virgibacillus necropolis]|uniref:Uncharacterized protein n=1 Tax=Virgibacillus necropolis TaxID=163877 RepID=A0A221MFS8_9BACI|nr:hypothetical protein [Virgibacillus necropolis]ASN06528.1 hypothetical protein CFK40_16650 [Virgibacillus necropolis]